MLNKSQLVNALVERGAGDRRHVTNMLNHLTDIAVDEIEAGEDFVIPGIAKIEYRYRKPQAKGTRWAKGDEVTGFGGVTSVKDAASPAVTKQAKLRAVPTGAVARLKPGSKPDAQKEFFASKTGKAVARRKG